MKIMNKSIICLVCFLSFCATVLSQNRKIDSLKNELKNHLQKDTIRVRILNNLAYYNYRNNPSLSLQYSDRAGKLADEIKSKKGKARSFYMKGITYMEQTNFEVSINNYKKAIELYTSINDLKGLAGCYNAMGVLHKYRGNLKLALEYYKKALEIDKKLGIKKNAPHYLYNIGSIYADTGKDQEALTNFEKALNSFSKDKNQYGILSCLNAMALVYENRGNYPLAVEYHNKSLEVAKKSGDSLGVFQSLNNIGNVYRQQQLYDKALSFYNQAIDIPQANRNIKSTNAIKNNMGVIYIDKEKFTTAIPYFTEVIKLSREIKDNEQLAVSLNGLGFSYLGIKKYPEALASFQESNKITAVNQKKNDLVGSYIGMSTAYYYMKKYKLALTNAEKGAQLSKKYRFLIHERDAYELLSKINNELKDHKKAFVSNEKLKRLNDSLFNGENIQKITQIEYEHKYKNELESAEKRELKLTKTVKTTSQNLEKSQRNLLLGVIAFLTTTIVLGAVIFFLKLRNEKSKTQNIVIEQKLLRSQMTPHFIFNSLSVLQGMILNKEEKKSISYLSKFSKLLRITLENSRDKTVSLTQELIAVENYLELQNMEAAQSYEYTVSVDDVIDSSLFKIPPMLIQPFIENAIEHGFKNQKKDKMIDILLTYSNKELRCVIKDNGIGIDANQEKENKHKKSLATTITSERLKMLSKDFKMKGSVTVEDRKKYDKQGTMVTLVIPYKIELT